MLHKVASLNEIPPGETLVVDVKDLEILLCHVPEEGIYAIDNICTHDAGPLDGGAFFDHCVECPRHGARFDVRTGAVLRLPAVTPVESYHAEIEGEDVYIWLPD
jgi:3-phenylpropionate/trans-cinnamate dioxygenase ferredoxin subunit